MKTIKHFIALLLCISLCVPLTQAQTAQQDAQAVKPVAQDVLIIIQQEQVRFTAQKAVAEMQLQVVDQSGQLMYDSGAVTGTELTWALRQGDDVAVKSGLYAYTLSVKEAGAETAQVRRGHFIVDRAKERDGQTDRLWVTSQNDSGVGTELTVARNEGATIAGMTISSERQNMTAERNGETAKSETKTGLAALVFGTTGRIAKFVSSTDVGDSVISEVNGNLGVGITNPISKLHIYSAPTDVLPPRVQNSGSNSFAAGWDFYHGATPKGYVGAPGPGVGIAPGEMLLFGSSGTPTSIWAGGTRAITVSTNGTVGLGTTNPNARLEVIGTGWAIQGRSTGGGGGVYGEGRGLGFGGMFRHLDGGVALNVAGTTRTNTLQITGGADFAENFEVGSGKTDDAEMTAQIPAGMVVSINPANPGKLRLSAQAYDRRVAGVISGAGGVKPGMVMSQEGTLAEGKYPVALSGRVYVWVDASRGAIAPGDLLTTSGTPGHAMKAADAKKAQGAIIGKAMTGLKSGKGLVLVLVTLQ